MKVFLDYGEGWVEKSKDEKFITFQSVADVSIELQMPISKTKKLMKEEGVIELTDKFPELLKARRKELDMTQAQLAEGWEVTQPEVHERETSNPFSISLTKYLKLCRTLKVGMGYFLSINNSDKLFVKE